MARRLHVQKRCPDPQFHPFGRLPTELRNKIWLFSLPGPRIVAILFDDSFPSNGFPQPVKVTSPTKPTNLLFVNKESRHETRRQYKELNFGPKYEMSAGIYVDFEIDTVYLSAEEAPTQYFSIPGTLLRHFDIPEPERRHPVDISESPQLHLLKSLAISNSLWKALSKAFLKTSCPNLESLTISFQNSTLHDIKPASAAETVIFMHDSEYFSTNNLSLYAEFVAADHKIKTEAKLCLAKAIRLVTQSVHPVNGGVHAGQVAPANDDNEEEIEIIGRLKAEIFQEATWIGWTGERVRVHEIEIDGRVVVLKFVMALYPREKIFDDLKPSLRVSNIGGWN